MKLSFDGHLEVDQERGVVYFHANNGECLLRLEGIPIGSDPRKLQIDVRLLPAFKDRHPIEQESDRKNNVVLAVLQP